MLSCATVTAAAAGLSGTTSFLRADAAFVPDVWSESDSHTVAWTIAPGYYLYGHALAFELNGEPVVPDIPAGTPYYDEHFGDVAIYRNQLFVTLPPDAVSGELVVRYQGCADAGLCYPPQTRRYELQ